MVSFSQTVHAELVSDENLRQKLEPKRAFVRECFLYGGVISNPGRTYHVEFALQSQNATNLMVILTEFGLNAKKIARGGQVVVYLKESDSIADILNIMGAHKSLLALENMRVEKNVRNTVNRKVNFETANINKTVSAAQAQINAIEYIAQEIGLQSLPKPLKEIAELRLENQTLTLSEIGELLQIGKSGANHRMRKICKIAEKLKEADVNG